MLRTLGYFKLYVQALAGRRRESLLVRIGAAFGAGGSGILYLASHFDGFVHVALLAVAYGLLAICVFLLIIAFPSVKRFWSHAGIFMGVLLVVAYAIGYGGVPMLVLAAALVLMSISMLLIDERYLSGYIRGAMAEWRVHQVLSRFSKEDGRLFSNAIFRFGTNSDASIEVDHILVNYAGVFVVETKGLSGIIDGDQYSDYWRQILGNVENQFFSPIKQNNIHVDLITRLVGEGVPVHSVVVFTSATFASPMPSHVVRLRDLSKYLRQFRDKVMDRQLVKAVAIRLEAAMDTSRAARDAHMRRVAAKRLTEYAN